MTDDQIQKLAFGCFWECDVKNGVATNFPRVVTPIVIEEAIRKALALPTEVAAIGEVVGHKEFGRAIVEWFDNGLRPIGMKVYAAPSPLAATKDKP